MPSTSTRPLGRTRRRLTTLAAVFALSVAGLTVAAAPAHAATTTTVYVANYGSGTVSVVDAGSNTVTATIPVGTHPWGEAVNPGGTRLYVANNASSTVSVINTMTDTVVDTIATTSTPRALTVNPAGTKLFVGGFNQVQMVNTATDTVTATIPVGQLITSIAVSPDGAHAYVLNNGTGTISVIDTATATVSATWNILGSALAVSPDGAHLYVTSSGLDGLDVVDTATGSVTATVATGQVFAIALNPAGTTAYVTNTTSVIAVDLTTDTVTATVPVGSYPLSVAVNSTGTSLYAANLLTNNMATLNTSTNTVAGTVPVGSQPRGIAVADVPAPPTVGSLSPNHGPAAGGTSVTITGSGFTGAGAVSFGSTPASSFTVNSDTSITATAPAGSGTVDVTVTAASGTSATSSADQYAYIPAPVLTGISPAHGPEAGATSVVITGSGFTGASAVAFGTVAASSFTVDSDTHITATAPAHTDGTVDVTVTTGGGTSVTGSADQYTYDEPAPAVTAINPASGPEAGGTAVTITGTDLTGATAVHFGAQAATSFTVTSDTQITATAPAGSDGIVDVTVTTAAGTSPATADHYTYLEPGPVITGISPAVGSVTGGTAVTITGTDFLGATAVSFGGTAAASFTVNSDTQITATAPAASALGPVDVTVTTAAGTSATGPADRFAYVNEVAKVTAAGRLDVGGHDAEFGFAARRTAPGGPIKGHLNYDNDHAGVDLDKGTVTVFYLTSANTAHAEGTATCTIAGVASPCTFSLNATDNGDPAEHDDGNTHADSFTLTYNTTTVGGTIEDGHVEIAPETGGSGHSATTSGIQAAAHSLRLAGNAAQTVDATPATAAMTGGFSTSLLGISLSGGRCATATLIYTDGTAAGDTDCLLLGALGINIDLNLRAATGTLGTNTATVTGTATVTVAGLLPVTLPVTEVLTTSGTSGLQLTVGGVSLPILPVATGAIQIG